MMDISHVESRVLPVSSWRPARKFPDTYPGECPDGSYVLWHDQVHPLVKGNLDAPYILLTNNRGGTQPLQSFLSQRAMPALIDRVAVLAYGANRNPATLHIKLRDYAYRRSGDNCIPVLKGQLERADVVACGLHGQGYLYGELLLDERYTSTTSLDVRVLLLNLEQLRVMNDSEGIKSGMYALAAVPGARLEGCGGTLSALAYVANERVWRSPKLQSPLAFASVPASGRRLAAMSAIQMLGHVIEALDLANEVVSATGLAHDSSLPAELSKYLNGQWWYQFNTGNSPIIGYRRVMSLFRESMVDGAIRIRTLDLLRQRGVCLNQEEAYAPSREFFGLPA